MEPRYLYIDPRGARTGPFSEAELERLAEVGGIEWAGFVELEGTGRVWRVTEVGWLATAMARRSSRGPVGTATDFPTEAGAAPTPAPHTPDLQTPDPARPVAPPTMRFEVPAPIAPAAPACSRATFIILALLPALLGIFGIHNLVAGYTARGVTQLVLSIITLGGVIGAPVMAPCCCIGAPLWLALFVWTLIEVVTVVRDARGNPLA